MKVKNNLRIKDTASVLISEVVLFSEVKNICYGKGTWRVCPLYGGRPFLGGSFIGSTHGLNPSNLNNFEMH